MGTVNMAVDFGGVKMQNPINTAAGTFGYGWQFQNFFDVSQLGAITTKGCAAEPWPGNPAPRMAEIPGGMINSVGLQNPGVAAFARESGPWLEQLSKDGCQVICQVAGHSVDEFVRALEMYVELCPWAAGYEINVSCPNIAAGGAAMGSTPEGASSVMAACRKVTDKPLFVKMAPVNVAEIAKALEAAGADGLSVITPSRVWPSTSIPASPAWPSPRAAFRARCATTSPCAWSGRLPRPSISPSTASAVS